MGHFLFLYKQYILWLIKVPSWQQDAPVSGAEEAPVLVPLPLGHPFAQSVLTPNNDIVENQMVEECSVFLHPQ